MEPVIRPLGEPEDDDVVLLNVVASLENVLGNYERAQGLFEKLRLQEPENETIIQNYSATLDRAEASIRKLSPYLRITFLGQRTPESMYFAFTPLSS